MADIFDTSSNAATATPTNGAGDIFDQAQTNTKPDIFDQTPKQPAVQKPQPLTFAQKLQGYTGENPIRGRIIQAGLGMINAGENVNANIVGAFDPQAGAALKQEVQQAVPVQGAAGKIAATGTNIVGGLGSILAGPETAIPYLGSQGVGGARNDITQLRNQGKPISGTKEALLSGAAGTVNAGTALIPGFGTELSEPILQKVAQLAAESAVAGGMNTGLQTANNVIAKGYDPTRSLTEGDLQAFALGSAGHGIVKGAPELMAAGETGTSRAGVPETSSSENKPLEPNPSGTPTTTPPAKTTPEVELSDEKKQQIAKEENDYVENLVQQENNKAIEAPRQALLEDRTPEELASIEALKSPHLEAQRRADELLQKAPQFTEGEAGKPTQPGEIGYGKGPNPLAEAAAAQAGKPPEVAPTNTLADIKGQQAAREEGTYNQPARSATEDLQKPGGVNKAADTISQWWHTGEVLKKAKAGTEYDIHKAVSSLKPFEDIGAQLSPLETYQNIESIENTGKALRPDLQPLADVNRKLNEDNISELKKLGFSSEFTDNLNPNWIKRKAVTARNTLHSGQGLAGGEGFLKARTLPTFEAFANKTENSASRALPYTNIAHIMMTGPAEIARSINARKSIDQLIDQGLARNNPISGLGIPAGWQRLPDPLANDPIINGPTSSQEGANPKKTQIIVPDAVAKTLQNHWDNMNSKNPILEGGRTLRYIADTFNAPRALYGQAAWSMGQLFRGNFKGAIPNYLAGRRFLKGSIDAMKADPTTAPIADYIEGMVKTGGLRSSAFQKMPISEVTDTNISKLKRLARVIPDVIQNHVVQPLKIGAALQAAEYTSKLAKQRGWTPEEHADMNRSMVKTIDNLFSGTLGAETAPPWMTSALHVLAPTVDYHTAGYRLLSRGIGESASRGSVARSSLPEGAAALLGHIAAVGVLGTATQYLTTGKVTWPQTAKDLFFPTIGTKNPDGSDQRIAPQDTITALAEDIMRASQGRSGAALRAWIDPSVITTAESVLNRNYRGDLIGSMPRRGLHAISGFAPILAGQSNESVGQRLIRGAESLGGYRVAPQDVDRSEATNFANDILRDRHAPLEPGEAEHQQQVYDLVDKLKSGDKDAKNQLNTMLSQGQVTSKQFANAYKRSTVGQGLPDLVSNPEFRAADLQQIWEKATPQEQAQIKTPLLRRIDSLPLNFIREIVGAK